MHSQFVFYDFYQLNGKEATEFVKSRERGEGGRGVLITRGDRVTLDGDSGEVGSRATLDGVSGVWVELTTDMGVWEGLRTDMGVWEG